MKALSVILISLSLLILVVMASSAHTLNSHTVLENINSEPTAHPINRYKSYLPITNHLWWNLTPTTTNTPSPTSSLADLIPIGFSVNCDFFRDCWLPSPGEITGKVVNRGNNEAGRFVIQFSHQSYNSPYIGEPVEFDSLSAGEFAEVSWKFKSGGPIIFVSVVVDIKNQVNESNEENNINSINITPPPYCTTITPIPQ